MKRNVGEFDALLRLSFGFACLGNGIMKKSKPLVCLGSMKIAEGLMRWCPGYAILGISTYHKCNSLFHNHVEEEL